MNKGFKKIVAVVSAIAMVVSSVTVYNAKSAHADIYTENEWMSWFNSGQSITPNGTDGFTITDGNIGDLWWHIQTWLPAVNMTKGYEYTCSFTLTTDKEKQFKVDNRDGDATIFTETSTEGWVDNGNGTYSYNYVGTASPETTSQVDVRVTFGKFDGEDDYGALNLTMSNFSITRVATGETEADPTTAAVDTEGYLQLKDATDTNVGEWTIYAGTWGGGKMAYKGSTDDLALKILSSNNNPGSWGLQAKRAASVYSGLTADTKYTMTLKYNSTAAGRMFVKQEGVDEGKTYDTVVGENIVTADFTYVATLGAIVLELSGIPADTEITNISFSFAEAVEEETTTVTEQEETTTVTEQEETTTEASGEADYSTLSYKSLGESLVVGSNNTKVPISYAVLDSESKGNIVTWMTEGAGNIGLYGDMWMSVTWHGDYKGATLSINGTDVVEGANGVAVANDVQANVQATVFINNNSYNKLKVTSADGTQYVTFILKVGSLGGEEETTSAGGEETTAAPSYTWSAIDYAALTYSDEATLAIKYNENAKYATVGEKPIDNVVAEADGMWIIAGAYGKAIQLYLNGTLKAENKNNSALGHKIYWNEIPQSNEYNDITVVFTDSEGKIKEYRYIIHIESKNTVVTDEGVKVLGWQIACGALNVGNKTFDGGVRTVYSIASTVAGKSTEGAEVGLVYGFTGKVTEADMYVGAASTYVKSLAATPAGKLTGESYGSADSTDYAMIMASNLSKSGAKALNQKYYVRAYVLIDGEYYYSDVQTYSTYEVASYVYDSGSMKTPAGHAYLYALLVKVTPDYPEKEFVLVDPPVVKPSEDSAE